MMKRFFSLLVLTVTAAVLQAQPEAGTFSLVPRVGVSLSTLSKDAVFADYGDESFSSKMKAGMTAGLDAEYQLLPRVGVALGARYAEMGCKYDNGQVGPDRTPGRHSGFSNMQTNLKYVNVPLTLNLYLARNLAFKTGVQVGFCIYDKFSYTVTDFTTNEDGTVEYQKPVSHKDDTDYRKVDVAIPLGLSYEYMNVVVDARYNIGLTRLSKVMGSYSPKNGGLTVSVGYRINL